MALAARTDRSWRGALGPPRAVRAWLTRVRGLSPWAGCGLVAALLAASVGVLWLLGGAERVAPHWFYVPIIVAAARFGVPGALATALTAGLLAGLVPADVTTGEAQPLSDWGSRAVAFLAIGLFGTWLVEDTAAIAEDELEERRLEHELLAAVEVGQLRLHYQPVVSLTSGETAGVEALVRWEHPTRGLLTAGEFIPLAERSGLVVVLGAWVLEEACRQLAEWRRGVLRDVDEFWVAVNVSGVQLDRPAFFDDIVRVLDRSGLPPAWLHIEVTETSLVENLDDSVEALLALKQLGVRASVDDFGTGYSSLTYLRRLPVETVKVDQSFVHHMLDHADDAAIVSAVISLAHSLSKTALAEGVENADQVDALTDLGCDLAQGYYFARPSPPDMVPPLLRPHRVAARGR